MEHAVRQFRGSDVVRRQLSRVKYSQIKVFEARHLGTFSKLHMIDVIE